MPQPAPLDISDNQFYGIESVEVYRAVINDREIFELLADIVQLTYETFLGKEGKQFVIGYLRDIEDLGCDCTTDEIKEVVGNARETFQSSCLNSYYHQVFRKNNLLTSVNCVEASWFEGTVVDIGAHDNVLGQVLLGQNIHVSHVIGVDITPANDVTFGERLEFRIQEDSGQVPVCDASADTVVLRYVLHHAPFDEQLKLLGEAKRILKSDGTVVVFENTYSFIQPPLEDRYSIHQRIIKLGSRERIQLLLAVLDTFSQGIKEKYGPFPFTYRSIEEWLEVFPQIGLATSVLLYYGMPLFDLHQAPLGIFILRHS